MRYEGFLEGEFYDQETKTTETRAQRQTAAKRPSNAIGRQIRGGWISASRDYRVDIAALNKQFGGMKSDKAKRLRELEIENQPV